MHYLVTGGAGFIGSNLVDRLLARGLHVTAFDNFSTGFEQFLIEAAKNPKFRLVRGDLLDRQALGEAMHGVDFVFHLSANADVRFGTEHPNKDLEQNTIATFNVLEAMRQNGVRGIAFASTGSIYGEPEIFPTPETAPFPIQTSLYGASKLAGEGLIQAYCEGFGFKGWIFRFVSILGERYTHGHIFDFFDKLSRDPTRLEVLGDGKQRKSYLYVHDCIDAIFTALDKANGKINIFNLGQPDVIEVKTSARIISETLGMAPEVYFTGGERGWIGDSPFILLDIEKITTLGWRPRHSIQEAIVRTTKWLKANQWVYEIRK